MKIKLYIILFIVLCSCKTQKINAQYAFSNLEPFIGTWEYKENNQIFRVTLYEDKNYIKGDYELVEINNGVETKLYISDYSAPGTDFNWGYAIFGGSLDGKKMGASIDDNSIDYQLGLDKRKRLDGKVSLTIIDSQLCLNCPVAIKAKWKVSKLSGLKSDTAPENFNIPIDVIMIKVK